ncbi:MAG: aminopeptidase [bacterium]|nr:aminopeptidase [bacterium]
MDEKIRKLSDIIINYSIKVEPEEKVLITTHSLETIPLIKCLIKDIQAKGASPFIKIINSTLTSLINEKLTKQQIDLLVKEKYYDVNTYDSFITIRYTTNEYEEKYCYTKMRKILDIKSIEADDIKINQRKWILLNYPSVIDAYKAKMKIDEYKEFAFETMTIDYQKLYKDLIPLKQLMEQTNEVKVIGPNTNLTFSIKDMPAIICAGESNIPDGEVYTAPIKESVNGYITYNTPSPYKGNIYHNIKLTFKNGKIIEAVATNDNDKLNEIFATDEGAKYIGEFSLGVNPQILNPVGDILYDEKISGSMHFTPGRAYKDAYNGNTSAIHWDLVLIQRSEYGGGEIYFDNKLIRKDGIFVDDTLNQLNKNT